METTEKNHVAQFLAGAISIGELNERAGIEAIPNLAENLHRRWARANADRADHKPEILGILNGIIMRDVARFGTRYMTAVSDLWTEKSPEQVRAALPEIVTGTSDEVVRLTLAVLKHNR